MAKKAVIDNRPFCDDCAHAEWHTQQWNLNHLGEPITYWCKKKVFQHGEVRGRNACDLWKKR